MSGIALIGAGRIGRIHAENLNRHPLDDIRYIVDVVDEAALNSADERVQLAGLLAAEQAPRKDLYEPLLRSWAGLKTSGDPLFATTAARSACMDKVTRFFAASADTQ